MANNIEVRKYRLIELIMQLSSEQAIAKLEQEAEKVNKKDLSWAAIKPVKKVVSIDEMIKEQHYKPIKKADSPKKVATTKTKEPLEELLDKLTK